MKYIGKIATLLLVLFIAASCENEAEKYTPGEKAPEGCQNIHFATSNYSTVLELEPEAGSFDVALARPNKGSVGTVNLTVISNEENVFVVPATATFAADDSITTVNITYPTAKEGVEYNLVIAIEGDNVSPYTGGLQEVQIKLSILKWESIGKGYLVEGIVSTFFGVNPNLAYIIEIEKTTTANSTRYRFDSPFAKVATAVDELGGYNGYAYNDPEDVLEGNFVFVIDVTSAGAKLSVTQMGMDWGYGAFSCGPSPASGAPLGSLRADVITFPANSLYISMADYNNEGRYPCETPTYVYLTVDAYAKTLAVEDEGDEDEGEEGGEE